MVDVVVRDKVVRVSDIDKALPSSLAVVRGTVSMQEHSKLIEAAPWASRLDHIAACPPFGVVVIFALLVVAILSVLLVVVLKVCLLAHLCLPDPLVGAWKNNNSSPEGAWKGLGRVINCVCPDACDSGADEMEAVCNEKRGWRATCLQCRGFD